MGVTKQIEYFFSTNELCRNTWVRQHMDTEGYLPAAIVFNFPSVVAYGIIPYHDLLTHIHDNSNVLDVDMENETIRVTHGWSKWLYPNDHGGFGCPRWIKQPQQPQDHLEQEQQEQEVQIQEQETQQSITQQHDAPDLVHSTDSETDDDEQQQQPSL